MDQLGRYRGISDNLDAAIDWLITTELGALHPGTIPIRGDAIRALVQQYTTVPTAGLQYEAHRKYMDIQCVVAGVERMLVVPIDDLKPAGAYDDEKDVILFDAPPAGSGSGVDAQSGGRTATGKAAPSGRADLVVPAGAFAVFFPEDGHIPMLQAGAPAGVHKVVVKVAV
jgi:beta-galactosidase beta subunit